MKWLRTILVINKGDVFSSADWDTAHSSYVRAIQSIHHPDVPGKLVLRKKRRLDGNQWERNGVNYLRASFLRNMTDVEGWSSEGFVGFDHKKNQSALQLYPSLEPHIEEVTSEFGDFDFVTTTPNGVKLAIEWETGNISSSHRSLNKLSIALKEGIIQAGVLIVPSRLLYEHLTDRIGNIGELSCYLSMWQVYGNNVQRGLLAVTVVEHDELTTESSHPYLGMGKDGRAREGRAKKLGK